MAIDKIGALWLKNSDNPRAPFASGEITVKGEKVRIVLWPNNKRPDKRDPDFQIAVDTPREPTRAEATEEHRASRYGSPRTEEADFSDDIPF
jgi:hypothetical protein